MFEAIHGSAPDITGQNVANPSGLINGAIRMLVHIGKAPVAERIYNAWLVATEYGQHTADIYRPGHGMHLVGTSEFADAIIERLGRSPERLRPWSIDSSRDTRISIPEYSRYTGTKTLAGADLYVDWVGDPMSANTIGEDLKLAGRPQQRVDDRGES
ncbi:MAG: isocitrate/isopropylmalate family dehydrogenase [bacterium]